MKQTTLECKMSCKSIPRITQNRESDKSNRVSDFRDCMCSLFPKAILFLLLFYSTLAHAGVVLCGGLKKSPLK